MVKNKKQVNEFLQAPHFPLPGPYVLYMIQQVTSPQVFKLKGQIPIPHFTAMLQKLLGFSFAQGLPIQVFNIYLMLNNNTSPVSLY